MASYTDIIPEFKPYVQQLPVEMMVAVGMEKQKRYEDGISKLQTQINNVAGIELLRPQDKAYLQSKLNELGNNLRGVAAGDFSDFQLVNSVGGMIGQIGKDRIIQAGIQSTAWDKQQRSLMEEDRKKGTLAPENEANYSKKLRSYYESGLQDEYGNPVKFSGSYVPHFDVFKFAKENFDAVKPDGLSWDQVYETDANGRPKIDPKTGKPIFSPVMIRMEKEGRSVAQVRATLDQIFSDPRVSQQLNITGEYNFGGLDQNALRERVASQRETVTAAYDDEINRLNLEKNLAQGKAKDDIQQQIDKLKNSLDNVNKNYSEVEKYAQTNPDYVRGFLYKNDVRERYTTQFGTMKIKSQTMDNPGWKANFELQKEAANQTRWLATYEQTERLAKLRRPGTTTGGAPGVPGGAGAAGFTQADKSSAIDVVYNTENDYSKAASDFTSSADNFVWEMAFANNPSNKALLDNLMAKGNTKDQAIGIILQNTANKNKQSIEEFMAGWGGYAERQYNKLPQRNIPHELKDAYTMYKEAKRGFDVMSSVKKKVDDATAANLGSNFNMQNLTEDIKPQTVKLYGKEYNLSKEDIYDLAVYLRGNQSSVGFLNDAGAHKAAKYAETRIKSRGNEPLLEAILMQNPASGGPLGLVTMAMRGLGTPTRFFRNFSDGIRSRISGDTNEDVDLSQVMKVYDKIDNEEFTKEREKKAEIIQNAYGIKPNLQTSLLTGDAETDRGILNELRTMAGEYSTSQVQNLSPDFKNFGGSLNMENLGIQARVIMDAKNNPVVEIVSYAEPVVGSFGRQGGMTIQLDEARKLGIDVDALYEPRHISVLRNYMTTKANQTSSGDPTDVDTYLSGDNYLEKNDFINLKNTPYDAKANFKYSNGVYYGYLYISDGTRRGVYNTPGIANLTELYNNLKQNTTSAFAEAILTQQ